MFNRVSQHSPQSSRARISTPETRPNVPSRGLRAALGNVFQQTRITERPPFSTASRQSVRDGLNSSSLPLSSDEKSRIQELAYYTWELKNESQRWPELRRKFVSERSMHDIDFCAFIIASVAEADPDKSIELIRGLQLIGQIDFMAKLYPLIIQRMRNDHINRIKPIFNEWLCQAQPTSIPGPGSNIYEIVIERALTFHQLDVARLYFDRLRALGQENTSVQPSADIIYKMICAHATPSEVDMARRLFDELAGRMPNLLRTIYSAGEIISAYLHDENNRIGEARALFDEIRVWFPVSIDAANVYQMMIAAYANANQIDNAIEIFDAFQNWVRAETNGEKILKHFDFWGPMIDGYLQCGKIDKAMELFTTSNEFTVESDCCAEYYRKIIAAFAAEGRIDQAWALLDAQKEWANILEPQRDDYECIVCACANFGQVDKARELQDALDNERAEARAQGLSVSDVDEKPYKAIISAYRDAGRLGDAQRYFNMVQRMFPRESAPASMRSMSASTSFQ